MSDLIPTAARIELLVEQNGNLNLSRDLLQSAGIYPGDPVRIIKTEEGLLLTPLRSVLAEVAADLSQMMEDEGITLDELMSGLDEAREQTLRELYPNLITSKE